MQNLNSRLESRNDENKLLVSVATTKCGDLIKDFCKGCIVDDIKLEKGNRILIKDQKDPIENGIYIVNEKGKPGRSTDLQNKYSASGCKVTVNKGKQNCNTIFICSNDLGKGVVGVNNLEFIKISDNRIFSILQKEIVKNRIISFNVTDEFPFLRINELKCFVNGEYNHISESVIKLTKNTINYIYIDEEFQINSCFNVFEINPKSYLLLSTIETNKTGIINKIDSRTIKEDTETVVSLDGLSEYNNLRDAIKSGARTIYIKNGDYIISEDLVLPSNCRIQGESKFNVRLIFDKNVKLKTVFNENVYDGKGLINITFGSNEVTGLKTIFKRAKNRVMPGQYLTIRGNTYKIKDVVTDTKLILSNEYRGLSEGAIEPKDYSINSMTDKIFIENLSILNSDINLNSCTDCEIKNVEIKSEYLLNFTNSTNVKLTGSKLFHGGIRIKGGGNNKIHNCEITECQIGVLFIDSRRNTVEANKIKNINYKFDKDNFGFGFGVLIQNSEWCKILNNDISDCIKTGIEITGNQGKYIVRGNLITTTRSGIVISKAIKNKVISNIINECSGKGIEIHSGENLVSDNTIDEVSSHGIDILSGGSNTIKSNIIKRTVGHSINVNTSRVNIMLNVIDNIRIGSGLKEMFIVNNMINDEIIEEDNISKSKIKNIMGINN